MKEPGILAPMMAQTSIWKHLTIDLDSKLLNRSILQGEEGASSLSILSNLSFPLLETLTIKDTHMRDFCLKGEVHVYGPLVLPQLRSMSVDNIGARSLLSPWDSLKCISIAWNHCSQYCHHCITSRQLSSQLDIVPGNASSLETFK